MEVGPAVGWRVGSNVGVEVGRLVGVSVGQEVGVDVGSKVGVRVGTKVGRIGLAVGVFVGFLYLWRYILLVNFRDDPTSS